MRIPRFIHLAVVFQLALVAASGAASAQSTISCSGEEQCVAAVAALIASSPSPGEGTSVGFSIEGNLILLTYMGVPLGTVAVGGGADPYVVALEGIGFGFPTGGDLAFVIYTDENLVGDVPGATGEWTQTPFAGTQTTTALTSSANPSVAGNQILLVATVSKDDPTAAASLTASVDFLDGTSLLATAPVDSSGQASFTTSALAPGLHSLTARYAGDVFFDASASTVLTETVNHLGFGEISFDVEVDGSSACGGAVSCRFTTELADLGVVGGFSSANAGSSVNWLQRERTRNNPDDVDNYTVTNGSAGPGSGYDSGTLTFAVQSYPSSVTFLTRVNNLISSVLVSATYGNGTAIPQSAIQRTDPIVYTVNVTGVAFRQEQIVIDGSAGGGVASIDIEALGFIVLVDDMRLTP